MRFDAALKVHLKHLRHRNASPKTVYHQAARLKRFARFLTANGIDDVTSVTPADLERFREDLFKARTRGRPLSICTQIAILGAVRGLYRSLLERGHLLVDLAKHVLHLKRPRKLPKRLPTVHHVERMLRRMPLDTPHAYRNRILCEVLYATGVRQAELSGLKEADYDRKHRTLYVVGKGLKDRTLPLTRRACACLDAYLAKVRPLFPESEYLFPSVRGKRLDQALIHPVVKRAALAAGLPRHFTTHSFRYLLATELLRRGAELRTIQEYLGHKNIETTALYTNVLGKDLKKIHGQTHPSERSRT